MTDDDEFVFAALGGLGEIGMNCALYGYGPARARKWLMVDLGVAFAGDDLPGVDLIMPDVGFIEKVKKDLAGIILTHAHEDHIGALAELWPSLGAQVYASPFAAGLAEARRLAEPGAPNIPIKIVKPGARLEIGPFDVEFVAVAHSIPESSALAIRTPAGLVVHSGDWKIDPTPVLGSPTDEARFMALGDEGVLALVCDSTNVLREGESPSERDVAAVLHDLIAKAKGRVVVTTFASNVSRLRSAAQAGLAAGRQICILGRAIERVVAVARECGLLDGVPQFLGMDAFERLPRGNVLALATGSQGEPRAALARMAEDEHPTAELSPGDTVIFSSRTIPGNEKAVGKLINAFVSSGVEVDHRPQRPGARLRPSAPCGAGQDVRLAEAQDRRAGAWRGAAFERACRLRQGAGRAAGSARFQRRSRALRARRRCGDRQGRRRPAAEGRRNPSAGRTRNAWRSGGACLSPASSRSRSR